MIVIADTSPINYLVLINEIDILPLSFNTVVVPNAVWAELQAAGSPAVVRKWIDTGPSWIDIQAASAIDVTIQLGAGESEAISLAQEIHADLVLIDDRKARRVAIERGLRVAGTINILEAAAKRDLVDLASAFRKLLRTNFRVAPNLIAEILERNR